MQPKVRSQSKVRSECSRHASVLVEAAADRARCKVAKSSRTARRPQGLGNQLTAVDMACTHSRLRAPTHLPASAASAAAREQHALPTPSLHLEHSLALMLHRHRRFLCIFWIGLYLQLRQRRIPAAAQVRPNSCRGQARLPRSMVRAWPCRPMPATALVQVGSEWLHCSSACVCMQCTLPPTCAACQPTPWPSAQRPCCRPC